MAAAGAGVKSVFDVWFTPAFIQMSDTFHQAIGEGRLHAIGQAMGAFGRALYHGFFSLYPGFFAAFGRIGTHALPCDRGYLHGGDFSIPAILGVRWLERRDSHHDAPPIDQRELRKMTQRGGPASRRTTWEAWCL